MKLAPIPRKSLSDSLYEQLRDAIVEGEIAPGQALPSERLLAEQAGVNRQAVREALARLRQSGMITIVHGGGAYAADLWRSADMGAMHEFMVDRTGAVRQRAMADLSRMRNVIAVDMVELACRRGNDADRQAVADAVERAAALTDRGIDAAFSDALEEVWTCMARASGNLAYRLAQASFRSSTAEVVASLSAQPPPEALSALMDLYRRLAAAVVARDRATAIGLAGKALRVAAGMAQTAGVPGAKG